MARKPKAKTKSADESSPQSAAPAPESPVADDAGVSLDRLTAAFAELMQQQPAAKDAPSPPPRTSPKPTIDVEAESAAEAKRSGDVVWSQEGEPIEPQGEVTVRGIIEAALFVGHPRNLPLPGEQIAGLIRGVHAEEVDAAIHDLNALYDREAAAYRIQRDGAGYRLVLREELYPVRNKFYGRLREARLSQAAVECLAIVAYNEPLTAEEVAKIRGTPSLPILSQLVRRELLRIERTQTKPRVTKYYTTRRFLQLFHLDSLADLPRPHDLDQM